MTTAPPGWPIRGGGIVELDADGVTRLHRDGLVADDQVHGTPLTRVSADLDELVARREMKHVLAIPDRACNGFELAGDAGVETQFVTARSRAR